MSDDKGSDNMTLEAERKRKSDASRVKFCCRSLSGGNVWNSLADLIKIIKLREVGADDEKNWEIVQNLFKTMVKPARIERDSQQATMYVDHLRFQLVDKMHLIWDAHPFLDRA